MSNLKEDSLSQLVVRGSIVYNVVGASPKEIMSNLADNLPALPPLKKDLLLQAVTEREALMSTGIGNGIALPHPRTLLLESGEKPFVSIAFPVQPVDWAAPDNGKVYVVFLIISKTPKQHLDVLSKINIICRQENFTSLLSAKAPKEKIIAAIEEAEKDWCS